jgi:hypothetical protein
VAKSLCYTFVQYIYFAPDRRDLRGIMAPWRKAMVEMAQHRPVVSIQPLPRRLQWRDIPQCQLGPGLAKS